jgi:hypothetical protein
MGLQYRNAISWRKKSFAILVLGFIRLHVLYHAGKQPICGVELLKNARTKLRELAAALLEDRDAKQRGKR